MKGELTAAQVAERLGVGRSTVNLWCRQGRFPGARIEESPVGEYWLIPEGDIKDFQKPTPGRPPKKGKAATSPDGMKKSARKGGKKRT